MDLLVNIDKWLPCVVYHVRGFTERLAADMHANQ